MMDFDKLVTRMYEVAIAAKHLNCWSKDGKTSEGKSIFVFMSWDPGTAQKAEKLLREAGLITDDAEEIGSI